MAGLSTDPLQSIPPVPPEGPAGEGGRERRFFGKELSIKQLTATPQVLINNIYIHGTRNSKEKQGFLLS
jgi:hypothetical protein